MAPLETCSTTGFTRRVFFSAASATTKIQKIYGKLLTRASTFCPQTSHAAALEEVFVSVREMYPLIAEETTNIAKLECALLSLLPPASSFLQQKTSKHSRHRWSIPRKSTICIPCNKWMLKFSITSTKERNDIPLQIIFLGFSWQLLKLTKTQRCLACSTVSTKQTTGLSFSFLRFRT